MNKIAHLHQIIKDSDNIVFFGGAGVSTESNIPDFRGKNGLYQMISKYGYPAEEMLSASFFALHTREFYQFYFRELVREAKPNCAHYALADLEKQGKLKAIITQNIDGLHQVAGSSNVLELHGSMLRNYCLNCGLNYPLEFMLEQQDSIPHCRDCGALVRPDIVLYEESLDQQLLSLAARRIKKAATLIVGGTSLAVYPASGLLDYYRGDQLVLINKTPTEHDHRADLVINDSIGATLVLATK